MLTVNGSHYNDEQHLFQLCCISSIGMVQSTLNDQPLDDVRAY